MQRRDDVLHDLRSPSPLPVLHLLHAAGSLFPCSFNFSLPYQQEDYWITYVGVTKVITYHYQLGI
jgi:hypothetical protein